jgi:hypothetical protein
MAKKVELKKQEITPGYKPHAAARCKLTHCMGNPKKLKEAETFDGKICSECNLVFEYRIVNENEVSNQEKLEIKEEKIKKKTLTTSEKEIEKLIKEADKKDQKTVKTQTGKQQSMF